MQAESGGAESTPPGSGNWFPTVASGSVRKACIMGMEWLKG
jgi:hypothetical protein